MAKRKSKQAKLREKIRNFNIISIAACLLLTVVLTALFIHFDIFTFKSVYYEYTSEEKAINEQIIANTHKAATDNYGDLTIPKSSVSQDTISYFESDDLGVRILAYQSAAGNYITAFDRCQRCRDENSAFYEQNGMLRCLKCGEGVTLEDFGTDSDAGPRLIPSSARHDRTVNLVIPASLILSFQSGMY